MAYINGNEVLFSTQFTGIVNIDQTYDATSENPQSGKAVAEAADAAVNKAKKEAGALTLIDSVTLTEAVASYAKTLPANTYREIYLTGKIVMYGGLSDTNTAFHLQESRNGYRVAMVSTKCTDGQTKYVFGRMIRLPHRGVAGQISVSGSEYFGSVVQEGSGAMDNENAGEYIPSVLLSVAAQYANEGVVAGMAEGTKIQIWGR